MVEDEECIVRDISIHAPARGATPSFIAFMLPINIFQSTHPRGVRRTYQRLSPSCDIFQSTHPRGVRRIECIQVRHSQRDFNPRTREGCDLQHGSHHRSRGKDFNPRTREGCDTNCSSFMHSSRQISIHAPARGATKYSDTTVVRRLFQSTHPRGVRQ